MPADAVVFGEALVDFFPNLDQIHLPLEEVAGFKRFLGGAPANFAVGLARQGVPTALVTQVGNDAFGRFVQNQLTSEGIAGDAVFSHGSARTGVTFVSLSGASGRSFLFYRHPSADMLIAPGQIDERAAHLRRGHLFHFGSSTLSREPCRAATLRALELATGGARRRQSLVSCDVNLRPHLWPEIKDAPPLLRRLLADCDIVKLVPEELPLLFGTEDVEEGAARARKAGATVVAVTLGDSGCYIDSPAGATHFAAESIRQIDPTGAGDAFCAGLVARLLAEVRVRDPEDPAASDDLRKRLATLTAAQIKSAASHACHLGALACTALGATTAIPLAAASPPPPPTKPAASPSPTRPR